MAEVTFVSNKTRKEIFKYIFVLVFAVILWILQISVFGRLLVFDTSINIMFLSCVYLGITFGPKFGTFSGIAFSFLSTSILYDHIFYISYPLCGLIAGLLTKNFFSDERLFYILMVFLLSFPLEFLNGWQYSISGNPVNILDRYLNISVSSAMLNLLFAPLYYFIMKVVTKKLKLRQE